jgi:eukaryotic-like serine/threonine-protein kinase
MLTSGRELDHRFVLERRLGSGGYGEVWLARDRQLGELIALKILPSDAHHLAALEREYEASRQLDHPNILRVSGIYKTPEHVCMAMEYAAGGDVSQLRGRSVSEVLRVALAIAAGLAHAHRRAVIHRDVKPSNVLLMSDGTPKLSDFGIASARRLPTVPAVGSPFSMSPQQRSGEPPNVADDVYAFGATIYELLSGYPPFYPDGDLERIRTQAVPPLPACVRTEVAEFVYRLLAKSPAERPATMETIESELKKIAHDSAEGGTSPPPIRIEPPSLRAGGSHGEPLRGEWRRTTSANVSERQLRREGFRRGLGVSLVALGIVAVLIVFFALPRWVEQGRPTAAQAVPAAQPAKPAAEKEQPKELDFAALAKAKQAAEEVRTALDARIQKLRERAVDVWGGSELQRLDQALASGDQSMQAREYPTALEQFSAVEPLVSTLEARAPEVLAAQLAAGAKALQDGRSADAKNAFELAAKIEPNNAVAAQGLKRASSLDEVLGLIASAKRSEKEGQPQVALDQYRRALALDPQTPGVNDAIARIESELSSAAFASAMAKGFGALANSDHAAARAAFQDAAKIRPNAPEVSQALRQIEQEQRTGVIGTKLRAAQALEAQEQWAEALKEYRSALELDNTVAAANDGVSRVAPRAALNEQLELYLTQPERLFSQPVRAAAHETLGRAKSIATPGPVLQSQITKLSDWLSRADQPVPVALQSDNQTQVTIHRIGSLGAFEQRSLELAPGTYTVVGTRPGYRDVRRKIDVMPGEQHGPVVIRCEDKI